MALPTFVSVTDARTLASRRVCITGGVHLSPFTTEMGKDASVATATLITTDFGSVPAVGTEAQVAAILAISPLPTGPRRLHNIPITPAIALASMGTDAVSVDGTWYYSEGYNPAERTVTTIACLNGTNVGTDVVIYAIWDADGVPLGWTSLLGETSAVADVFQDIDLVEPIQLPAGRYYVGFQVDGTTAAHQTMAAGHTLDAASVAGTFGDPVPTLTIAGTFTAGKGPFHRLT